MWFNLQGSVKLAYWVKHISTARLGIRKVSLERLNNREHSKGFG